MTDNKTYHDTRFLCLDTLHQRYDLLLNGELVEHLATTELRRIMRDRNAIQAITDRVTVGGTAAQGVESFETTNLDAKRVCMSEDTSDHRK